VIAAKDTAESLFGSTRKDDPLVESGLLGPVRLPNPARQSLGR
jgi:hypothetical protein